MVSGEQKRAELLDGRTLPEQIKREVAEELRRVGIKPRRGAVLVGDDAASAVYVRNKVRACAEVGIDSDQRVLPAATTEELLALIEELNRRSRVVADKHGPQT